MNSIAITIARDIGWKNWWRCSRLYFIQCVTIHRAPPTLARDFNSRVNTAVPAPARRNRIAVVTPLTIQPKNLNWEWPPATLNLLPTTPVLDEGSPETPAFQCAKLPSRKRNEIGTRPLFLSDTSFIGWVQKQNQCYFGREEAFPMTYQTRNAARKTQRAPRENAGRHVLSGEIRPMGYFGVGAYEARH